MKNVHSRWYLLSDSAGCQGFGPVLCHQSPSLLHSLMGFLCTFSKDKLVAHVNCGAMKSFFFFIAKITGGQICFKSFSSHFPGILETYYRHYINQKTKFVKSNLADWSQEAILKIAIYREDNLSNAFIENWVWLLTFRGFNSQWGYCTTRAPAATHTHTVVTSMIQPRAHVINHVIDSSFPDEQLCKLY